MSLQRTASSKVALGSRAAVWFVPVLVFTGCAHNPARAIARAWEDVPKVRWSFTREADDEDDIEDTELAANSEDESSAEDETAGRTRLSSTGKEPTDESAVEERYLFASRRSSIPHDPFLEDEVSRKERPTRTGRPAKQSDNDEGVSQRERLRAALSDDSRRGRQPQEHTAKHDRLQLRVESLMERARYHLGRDELLEAQRAAEFAHKVVENSDLEFAPDEERPIDLLVTITDRRQSETAESSESQLALKPAKAAKPTAQKPAEDSKSGEEAPQDSKDATEFDPYAASPAQPGQPVQRGPVFETAIVMLDAPSFEDPADVNPTAYTASSDEAPMKRLLAPRRALPPAGDEQDPIEVPPELEQEALAAPPPPAIHESKPSPSSARSGPRLGMADDGDLAFDDEEDEPAVEEVRAASLWPRWLPLSLLSLLTTAFCIWYWRRRAALAA